MKVAIIGAGNMGGAMAHGLTKGTFVEASDVFVANPNEGKLQTLKSLHPEMRVTTDNATAAKGADMVIVAVKPWLMEQVLSGLQLKPEQILVSVAAGVDFAHLEQYAGIQMPMFRVVPNTAIAYMESTTLIAGKYVTPEQEQLLLDIFNEMGLALPITESQMAATTALASCGIAFVLKYIQAAMQAGVEMGIYSKSAQQMVAQTVKGAAALLLNNPSTHPAVEIDKVTTPGGITIKGLNELEHNGYSSAIIKAMKVSR